MGISTSSTRSSPKRTTTTDLGTSGENQLKRVKQMVLGQLQRSGRLFLPFTAIVLLMSVVVMIFRKQKRFLPRWAVKLVSGWDLFESALFPNSAIRRMQRQQRNAPLV